MKKVLRAASDVGGTFTDLVLYRYGPDGGEVETSKVDTTPPDFERGVMASLKKLDVDPSELDFFAHGSTVVINALTERKGATTALITTKGFRDVLEIARGNRPDLFNFNFRKPKPFVDRYLRLELEERTDYHGHIQTPVNLDPLAAQVEYLKSEGVTAIALAFLRAYINPANEQRAVAEIERLWPEVSVLASHQVSREWREYERTNTTVLSAYVHPYASTESADPDHQISLSPREMEVLWELSLGRSNKQIARALYMTEHTVKFHLKNVFRKFAVNRRTEALKVAHEAGLI